MGGSLWRSEGVGAVHVRECVVHTLFASALCIMSDTCALMAGWMHVLYSILWASPFLHLDYRYY